MSPVVRTQGHHVSARIRGSAHRSPSNRDAAWQLAPIERSCAGPVSDGRRAAGAVGWSTEQARHAVQHSQRLDMQRSRARSPSTPKICSPSRSRSRSSSSPRLGTRAAPSARHHDAHAGNDCDAGTGLFAEAPFFLDARPTRAFCPPAPRVTLGDDVTVDLGRTERASRSRTRAAACAARRRSKPSAVSSYDVSVDDAAVDAATIATFPDRLREQQAVFDKTGGLHAAGPLRRGRRRARWCSARTSAATTPSTRSSGGPR